MNEWLKNMMGKLKDLWSKWKPIQKVIIIGIVLVVIVVIIASARLSSAPTTVRLFNAPVTDQAALTNILTLAWSGKSVQEYKELKGLKKENLRDNMTNTELALNLLAEVSTTELSRMQNPSGYDETKEVTISGGEIAGNARKELEAKLGRTVISSSNATTPELLDDSKK